MRELPNWFSIKLTLYTNQYIDKARESLTLSCKIDLLIFSAYQDTNYSTIVHSHTHADFIKPNPVEQNYMAVIPDLKAIYIYTYKYLKIASKESTSRREEPLRLYWGVSPQVTLYLGS